MSATLRVLFLHGMEGGPTGQKARFLAAHFAAYTPQLSSAGAASTPGVCPRVLDEATTAVREHRPDAVVGSSYGGAVLLELMFAGTWRGPAVFLASAGPRRTGRTGWPAGTDADRCLLVHGRDDDVVPFADSATFAEATGSPLWPVDDGHRLVSVLQEPDPLLGRAVIHVSAASARNAKQLH